VLHRGDPEDCTLVKLRQDYDQRLLRK